MEHVNYYWLLNGVLGQQSFTPQGEPDSLTA